MLGTITLENSIANAGYTALHLPKSIANTCSVLFIL